MESPSEADRARADHARDDHARDGAADITFLRERGCRCKLMIAGIVGGVERAVPFTICEEDGNRAICPKRMIPHETNVGDN